MWDNHIDGDVSSRNYATNPNPKIPIDFDLYKMPNTTTYVEKRYFYLDNIKLLEFFKDRIDDETVSFLEKDSFKKGDYFKTLEGTTMIYVENKHEWFEVPIKLENIIINLKDDNKSVILVGGAEGECLLDISYTFDFYGLDYSMNHEYIYSATSCLNKKRDNIYFSLFSYPSINFITIYLKLNY